jgi:zinc transporter ZupT
LNLFGSFGQFAYLITFKPFKEKTVFFAEFVGEVVILLVLIFSVLIFKSESCANSKILSNFFIFSVLFTLGVQTFISFYSLLVTLKKAYMKLKMMKLMKEVKNMNKIHPEVPCQTINDTDNSNINDPL